MASEISDDNHLAEPLNEATQGHQPQRSHHELSCHKVLFDKQVHVKSPLPYGMTSLVAA